MRLRGGSIKALGFFIVIMTIAFGSVLWYSTIALADWYEREMTKELNYEWAYHETNLGLLMSKAKLEGQSYSDAIGYRVNEVFHGDISLIANALDNYHSPDNKIREIITDILEDQYFNNIVSDSMDPFLTFGKRIETDNSDNCATIGESRSFEEEFTMHANPFLAEEAFYRILLADVENMNRAAIKRPIFFQFVSHPLGDKNVQIEYGNINEAHIGKSAYTLDSYDMEGLRTDFMRTQSWEITFQSFEFITPTYVLNKEDLALRRFVVDGLRTSHLRMVINVVFNYKLIIDHDPVMRENLENFKINRYQLKDTYVMAERTLFLMIFLLILLCSIAMSFTDHLSRMETPNGDDFLIQSRGD